MPLTPNTKLGQYEVVESIGAGGMGEVYRARDTKLGRDVAIKVLPEEFARDKERLDRFEREARLLAQLNHANIATLHGLEEHDGQQFLVMELVEGETLADRIAQGPLPVDEAIPLFIQIAEGLEAAHEKGIVHRDLKPANIKIGPDGKPKILDFGLAKAFATEGVVQDLSQSPTLTRNATETGVLLGTAPYMSPEQARGKPVDKKTDIWAFGCCLFEALTGKAAFLGETVSDTIGKILEREPDWNTLPAAVPTWARNLLRRCLQKDVTHRLHDVADARIEIEAAQNGSPEETEPRERPHQGRVVLWALLAAVMAGLAVWSVERPGQGFRPVSRLAVPVVVGTGSGIAISPDGTQVVYAGGGGLLRRQLDEGEAEPIPGTENARRPFFSPDGQWVGFGARGKLYKIQLPVSAPVALADAEQLRGATWGSDGTIVYAPHALSGLWRVPSDGGLAEEITKPDRSEHEKSHRLPHFLPGGEAVLFTAGTTKIRSWDDARIEILELQTGKRRVLIEGGTGAVYVPSGHIVYRRGRSLFAVAFDLDRLTVTGAPVPMISDVRPTPNGNPRVSENGTLVYTPGDERASNRRLVLVDRQGSARALTGFDHSYREPRFSPDGRHLVVGISGANEQLFRYDMDSGTLTQLTFEWDNYSPIWTSDGQKVIFTTGPNLNLFQVAADGSGAQQRLTTSANQHYPQSASRDGRYVAFEELSADSNIDIWILPLNGEEAPLPFLRTSANEAFPRFSSDGRFIAYTSDEMGRTDIYVVSFPDGSGKVNVSIDGGFHPMWARTGKELFYRTRVSETRSRMMVVEVIEDEPLRLSQPRVLFEDDYDSFGNTSYDVSPDDQHFVMIEVDREAARVTHFNIVLNWLEEVKRLVPTN